MVVCFALVLVSGAFTAANCWTRALWPSAKWIEERQESCVATIDVCSTAEITAMGCFMKKIIDSEKRNVNFRIGIKNISDWSRRYKVSLFLPEGTSAEVSCPEKDDSSLLKPGDERVVILPMDFDKNPRLISVRVECPWTIGNTHIIVIEKCVFFMKKILASLQNVTPPDGSRYTTLTRRFFCDPD